MPECVYCGEDAGRYDEHDECVWASLEEIALCKRCRGKGRVGMPPPEPLTCPRCDGSGLEP